MKTGEAYVQEFATNWKAKGIAAAAGAAMLTLLLLAGLTSPAHAQKKREYKDNAEYDVYNEVIKDLNSKNWAKMVTDIDTWKTKYPASDYSDTRDVYYVQANAGAGKCSKAISLVGEMMAKDLDKLYPDPAGPKDVITVLYTALGCQAQAQTPQELDTVRKAAEMLQGYQRRPEGITDQAWNDLKNQLKPAIDATLINIALMPGNKAMAAQPPDCAAAETAYTAALQKFPNNTLASYGLGRAWLCLGRANNQEKMKDYGPKAIYAFTRSMVIDPTLMKTADPAAVTTNATNMYKSYHGSPEGFEELKNTVKSAALPPEGFKIMTAYEVEDAKQKEFEGKYPELALWLKIKAPLSDTTGEQYFASTLKDADLPKLKGTLVEGVPACRSKSLLVSFPEPNQQGTAPTVVTLKLDAALTGKPDANQEIEFKGVPTAFTQQPFMLTLETEKANITAAGGGAVKTTPCTAAPPRAAPKKGVGTKKKG